MLPTNAVVTSHRCSGDQVFDPNPAKLSHHSHHLIGLLCQVCVCVFVCVCARARAHASVVHLCVCKCLYMHACM